MEELKKLNGVENLEESKFIFICSGFFYLGCGIGNVCFCILKVIFLKIKFFYFFIQLLIFFLVFSDHFDAKNNFFKIK